MHKKITILILVIIFIYLLPVHANEYRISYYESERKSNYRANFKDTASKIDLLYEEIANELSVPYKYVKILHLIAGGEAVYIDKNPSIKNELTTNVFKAPFEGQGINIDYTYKSSTNCLDKSINRPNKYYLPDAAYNATYKIICMIQEIEKEQKYGLEKHSDTIEKLRKDVKKDLIFYLALLEYIGEKEENINQFINIYFNIISNKEKYEFLTYIDINGKYRIKHKFRQFTNELSNEAIDALAIVFSYDGVISNNSGINSISDEKIQLYQYGVNSRENLLCAALSLTGKVIYVWGGGHMGTSDIIGESPIWEIFNMYYKGNRNNYCITPRQSWCPIHGITNNSDNGCLFEDKRVRGFNGYLNNRKSIIKNTKNIITYNQLIDIFKGNDFKEGIEPHRLEGLDCSGFIAWVYNQTNKNYTYQGVAGEFTKRNNMKSIKINSNLLPGDVIGWNEHIVMVIGKVGDNVYTIIEQAPNTIKLGVAINGKYNNEEMTKAKEIANKYNQLLGIENKKENINTYIIGNIEGVMIGRLDNFEDDNRTIFGLNKVITDMNSEEILNFYINKAKNN